MTPLTPRQSELLFLAKARPDRVVGVHQVCFAHRGLDLARLETAVRRVALRHPVMRRALVWSEDGAPEFADDLPLPDDVVRRDAPADGADLRARTEAEAARGLELATPPGFHLLDIPTGSDEGVLVCTFSTVLLDRRAALHLWRDIVAGYRGAAGETPEAVAATVPVEGPPTGDGSAHWRRWLGGIEFPAPLPFPARNQPPADPARPVRVVRALDPDSLTRAVDLAERLDCAPERIFEAVWSVLLRRYTRRSEVCFGTGDRRVAPSAAAHGEVVLPLGVPGDTETASFGDLCRLLDAQSRARSELGPVRPTSIHRALDLSPAVPLHETAVAVEWEGWASMTPDDGVGGRVIRECAWTGDALRLVVRGHEPAALRLEVDPERIDAAWAERIADHVALLLRAALDAPEAPALTLPVLTDDEAARLHTVSRGPEPSPAGEERGVLARFTEAARRRPKAPAIVAPGATVTYGELDRASAHLARRLRDVGVGRDTRVALLAERRPETLVALLAILRAGGAYVPVDPSYPAQRRDYMLDDSAAALLLLPPGHSPGGHRGPTMVLPPHTELTEGHVEPWSDDGPDPDALAYVIYTSGSTGEPKGVAMAHRALANLIAWQVEASQAGADGRTLQFASLSFDVSFQEIFATWCTGGALVLVEEPVRRNPVALVDYLDDQRVERLFLPFIALQQIAQASAVSGRTPGHLREVIVAGEQLRITPDIRDFFRRAAPCSLENQYGPAETHVVTAHRLGDEPDAWPTLPPIGTPLPGVRIDVLDPWGTPMPPGAVGELCIGGVALARGYLDRPELTAERFVSGGVPVDARPQPSEAGGQGDPGGDPGAGARRYRTGDLARFGADGPLEFVGRADHQVKIRGFRVEPGEVESVLEAHPGVATAAVVAGRDAAGSSILLAFVVAHDVEVAADDLRTYVAARLPGHMVPSRFTVLEALPLTPSGKIDRGRLADRAADPARPASPPAAPSGSVRKTVASVWARMLQVDEVPDDRSFFDLGGTSVLTLQTAVALSEALGREVPVTALFEFPTVAGLAGHLEAGSSPSATPETSAPPAPRGAAGGGSAASRDGGRAPVAVVGMDCRLPGAPDVEAFWRALLEGREGIRHFTREELLDAGVAPALLDDPDYVPARGVVDGADRFDADFFGYSPREARLMDPQHRLFLESCWKALESAGHAPDRMDVPVGVWGGMSTGMGYTTYLLSNLAPGGGIGEADRLQVMLGNANDYLTTRVSYKLDLRGPSVNVQTACSTSLVAVCEAVRSLRRGECDVALAGGVSVSFPQVSGHLHQEGGIESSDGRCRPFDARADGTVFSDGVATVVLRRLDDAVRDGDPIHAVIHGIGLNNDGAEKMSFSAPSVGGQAAAIRAAQREAGFAPESVGYVEAHGTATPLGDPIEVQALRRVFDEGSGARGRCALGSVKSNIGHTVAAAGTAALIKTVVALREGIVPPSLHFERPNPDIDLEGGPFFVADRQQPWPDTGGPRRAGVSSFGLGGTNAHVVLEQAPTRRAGGPGREHDLLLVSARSTTALDSQTERLADVLERRPDREWPDAAHTSRVGRTPMPHRTAVVASGGREAAAALRGGGGPDVIRGTAPEGARSVAFMFPGVGAQYPAMGRDLLASEPTFRRAVEECAAHLRPDIDLLGFLRQDAAGGGDAAEMERPRNAFPTLFSVEYALAKLWLSWGVRPAAMIGHSMGEYTAACIAGVLSLPDALTVMKARGRLFETLPDGSMIAVPLAEEVLREYLPDDLSVAVVNGPEACVASGPNPAVTELEHRLEAAGVKHRRVHVAAACHSALVDGILDEFRAVFDDIRLAPPRIPCISNLTGDWLTPEEATSPDYWTRHLRGTVRFSDGLGTLAGQGPLALLEVGPGRTLCSLARANPATDPRSTVVASLRHPRESIDDGRFILRSLGRLWSAGVDADWHRFVEGQERVRVSLPTYPFDGPSHLVTPAASPVGRPGARADEADPAAAAGVSPPAGTAPGGALQHALAAMQEQLLAVGATPAPRPPTPPQTTTPVRKPAVNRRDRILAELRDVVHDLSGIAPDELPADVSFLDMGFDSLFLTQASLGFKNALGVRVTFRQLFDEAPTLGALADYIDAELDDDVQVGPSEPAAPAAAPGQATAAPAPPAPLPGAVVPAPPGGGGELDIHRLLALQLQSTAALLNALAGTGGAPVPPTPAGGAAPPAPAPAPAPADARPAETPSPADDVAPAAHDASASDEATPEPARAAGPYRELNRERLGGLDGRQARFLDDFIERYVSRTRRSKELTQAHRDVFADPRAVAGFRRDWKEIVYPLAVERSKGARMWDVDGNEYIDAVSGFGAIFFGHAADFVVEAVGGQLERNLDYGPQSTVAGQLARRVCEATGMERASFCNTGSEAVLAAVRTARTVTGRDTLVTFNGAYHGILDEVLVRRQVVGRVAKNVPAAPGIPRTAIENVVVLDYGDPAALDRIRELGDDLAGVLVEPVQSRTPELQPREFLHGLRRLCTEIDVPLIFDEVITGFRSHPRGAQGWFGVQADVAAYGKVVGGGMPIGIVAGKAPFLDALDGGTWRFGDDSFPEAGVTYFAGTFIRHPLALAAVDAVLRHLEAHDGALQRSVNDLTARLAAEVNTHFEERDIPIHIAHFSSVFLPRFGGPPEFDTLFHRLLQYHGLHLWEGRPGFLTTAHTEADVDGIVEAFARAADEMVAGGLLSPSPTTEPRDREDRRVALTEAQTEIWLAAQMGDEGIRAFNEAVRLDLAGPVHVPAMQRAVRRVVARHEGLRATVCTDEPALQIRDRMDVPLHRADLTEVAPPERDEALREQVAGESNVAFDLAEGPLIRFKLIRTGPREHVLMVTAHHIVCDGWSLEVILRDLAAVYNHAYTGRRLELAAPMQLSEYNRHHRTRRQDDDVEEMRRYWVERFATLPPVLDLPTDRPRPPEKSYAGARHPVRVDGGLARALRELSTARGCTLFTTLLAAYNVLLHTLARESDVVVGVPTAGQARLGEGSLVAHCVNFLPIRSTVRSDTGFAAYLRELHGLVMDATDHQDFTYGALVEELSLPRDPSRVPLISASFNLDTQITGLHLHDLEWRYVSVPRAFAKLDIDLNVIETDDGLLLEIDHNTDLLDGSTALRWMEHYERILRAVVADPERPIGDLEVITVAEQARLIGGGAPGATEAPTARLEELVDAQVAKRPDAPALVHDGRTLSYVELDERARRIAAGLGQAIDPARHGPVGVLLRRSPEMVATLLGVLKSGRPWVPLDPDFPATRLRFIAEDAGLAAVVADDEPGFELPDDTAVVQVEELLRAEPGHGGVPASHAAELAYVIYTSGSTGQPKGVEVPHGAVVSFLHAMADRPGMDAADRLLAVTTISFDISILELFLPLAVGGTVILAPTEATRDGASLARLMAETAPTVMQATPSHWQLLVDSGWTGDPGLKVLAGGEALPPALAGTLAGTCGELWNMYGPTEATIWATCTRIHPGEGRVHIGRPLPGVRAQVLDARMRPVPPGVPGELWLGGACLARGYRNRPEQTAERFRDYPHEPAVGRLYGTGDVVRYGATGELEFIGRADRQVKLRGFRVELGEVESALASHPGVSRVVAVVRDRSAGDQRLVAYHTGDGALASADLREHLRARLPEYMVPQAFVHLDAFPRTANGKLDVRNLPDPFGAPRPPGAPVEDPMDEVEAGIATVWREVLEVQAVGRHDDFFDLGGHSVLAARVLGRLREGLAPELSFRDLFRNSTVADLAAHVRSLRADASAATAAEPETEEFVF